MAIDADNRIIGSSFMLKNLRDCNAKSKLYFGDVVGRCASWTFSLAVEFDA